MKNAFEYANYFVKQGIVPDTPEGEQKLQTLLALSQMAHTAEHGEKLFPEEIVALEDGFGIKTEE